MRARRHLLAVAILCADGCYRGASDRPLEEGGDGTGCFAVACTASSESTTDSGSGPLTSATPGTSTLGESSSSDTSSSGGSEDAESTSNALEGEFCPLDEPCRILPVGDSLTEGDSQAAYRQPLFATIVEAGQSITFVGNQANGPENVAGVSFPRNHEGHSGYYIDATHHPDINIADLVDEAIATHQPHIILLMIGTNDVGREHLPDSADRLAVLIDQVLADAPDAMLVVAQITPTQTPSDNVDVEAYNAAMPAIVAARADAGKNVVLVDMYGPFSAVPDYANALLVDNFHPNPEGDAIIAATWYAAIAPYLH